MELEGPFLLHNSFDVKMRKRGWGKKKEQEEAAQVESLYLMAPLDGPTFPEEFKDAACVHCLCVPDTQGFTLKTLFFLSGCCFFRTAKVGLLRERDRLQRDRLSREHNSSCSQ